MLSVLGEAEELCLRHSFFRDKTRQYRKLILKQKIKFWQRLRDENNILFYVNSNAPHLFDDYIAYRICKQYNIPILSFYRLPIYTGAFSRLMLYPDPLKQEHPLKIAKNTKKDCLDADFQKLYQNSVVERQHPVNIEQKNNDIKIKKASNYCKVKNILRKYIVSKNKKERKIIIREKKNNETYQKIFELNYFLLLLHYQPEASSRPLGGEFGDQLDLVLTLSSCLPPNTFLVVKEHPLQAQKPPFRYSGFYKRMVERENVILASDKVGTLDLAEKSLGVISLTGSALLEYALLGKPAIAMGTTPLSRCDGIYHPATEKELKTILSGIAVNSLAGASQHDILRFFHWLQDHSIEGYLDPYKDPNLTNSITHEQNANNISNVLLEHITKYLVDQKVCD